jgi:hypothetical protein
VSTLSPIRPEEAVELLRELLEDEDGLIEQRLMTGMAFLLDILSDVGYRDAVKAYRETADRYLESVR